MNIEKIRRNSGFRPIINSNNQEHRLKVEVKAPQQAKALSLAHRQNDRVNLNWDKTSSTPKTEEATRSQSPKVSPREISESQVEKPSPTPPPPSSEERFETLSNTLLEYLGEKGRAKMVKRALARSTKGPEELERVLALTARREARQHLKRLCPGLSEEQLRLKAASEPKLAAVLEIYDAAGACLGIQPQQELQAKRERQQTLNKLQEISAQMLAESRKTWAEIRRIHSEANTAVMEIWLEQMVKRTALQQKQFQQFLAVLQGAKAA